METLITILVAGLLIVGTVVPYMRHLRKKEHHARRRFEELKVSGLQTATSMHPHINALECIGCGGCVDACPEGDVLAVIQGKAVLVHGAKCVGHGLCAEACPVGGITMVMAAPGRSADLPLLNEHFETTIKNLYIVGELGGLGLIRNAVAQGTRVIDTITARRKAVKGVYDVAVVGAGPAGMSAALAAKKNRLTYLLLEQGTIGGTILQYPRRKIVMTSPVEIPLWGKLKLRETTKEALLKIWEEILRTTRLDIHTNEKVVDIERIEQHFRVVTPAGQYDAQAVVLAIGRRGTPRKLGVPGEERSKVTYRLIDAETYRNQDLLVVGGGDSAVEAAVGLGLHGTNRVTLSYRQAEFTRLKEKNQKNLQDYVRRRKITLILNSQVKEILEKEVLLETPQGLQRVTNDYVFIFAGGEMPFGFLRKIGIQFQNQLLK